MLYELEVPLGCLSVMNRMWSRIQGSSCFNSGWYPSISWIGENTTQTESASFSQGITQTKRLHAMRREWSTNNGNGQTGKTQKCHYQSNRDATSLTDSTIIEYCRVNKINLELSSTASHRTRYAITAVNQVITRRYKKSRATIQFPNCSPWHKLSKVLSCSPNWFKMHPKKNKIKF